MLQGGGRGGPGVQGSDPTGGQMGTMGMDQGEADNCMLYMRIECCNLLQLTICYFI